MQPDPLDTALAERVREPASHEEAQKWITESLGVLNEAEGGTKWTQISWAAILLGRFPWTPSFWQKVYWHPIRGITVTRSPQYANKYHDGTDAEFMSAKDIIAAPKPDMKYYWFTDLVRGWQNFWNTLQFWKPPESKKLWDGPGYVKIKYDAGKETLEVEFLAHPAFTWSAVVSQQKTFEKGMKAKEWLKAHQTPAQLVRAAAEFNLAVELEMEKIRQERQSNRT